MKKTLFVAALLSLAPTAKASLWYFSYAFESGDQISGQLSGDLKADGKTLSNVANMSLSVNGKEFNGSPNLYIDSYKSNYFGGKSNVVFSTDASDLNFIISDSSDLSSKFWTNIFYVIPPSELVASNVYPSGNANCYSTGISFGECKGGLDRPFVQGNWHLRSSTDANIPEPEAIHLVLVGLCALVFVKVRPRLRSIDAYRNAN